MRQTIVEFYEGQLKGSVNLKQGDRPFWNLSNGAILLFLGAKNSRIPDEGLPCRMLGNVNVWATDKATMQVEKAQRDGHIGNKRAVVHRVKAECPECGECMSAGRLHQHLGTKVCSDTRIAKEIING